MTIDNSSSKISLTKAIEVDGHTFGFAYVSNANGAKVFTITAKESVTLFVYYCTTNNGAIYTTEPTLTGGEKQNTTVNNVYKVEKALGINETITITGANSCRNSILGIYYAE